MLVYFAFVLGIGFALKRYMRTSNDFFLAGRSIPAWVCGLAFISANLGAQEVIGMGASGAKYGIVTSHFYWIGAIPAMCFVGIFMMPFYYGSKARSVPEFLRLRFDEKTRAVNAFSFAIHDHPLFRHLHVRHGAADPDAGPVPRHPARRLHLPRLDHRLRGDCAGLHLPRRPHQRHLQRGPAILPDRRRLPAAGLDRSAQRGRLAGHQADAARHR